MKFAAWTRRCGESVAWAALTISLCAFVSTGAHAEAAGTEPLYPIYENGKWGLINSSGDVILEPRFDQVGRGARWVPETWDSVRPPDVVLIDMTLTNGSPVTDPVIPVRLDGSFALATRDGEMVLLPDYQDVDPGFGDGLLQVTFDGKRGFIDESGDLVIAPRWDAAFPFRHGHAFVRLDGRWGIIDRNGDYVLDPRFDQFRFGSADLFAVRVGMDWGVVDHTGQTVVPLRFDEIKTTPMGPLMPVHDDGRIFYVQLDGKGTVAFEFVCPRKKHRKESRALGFFNKPLAIVICGSKYGLIDETGSFVVEPEWDDIKHFELGRAVVVRNNRQGLIDEAGRLVIEPQKNLRLYCCTEGLVGFWRDGAEGFFDLDGNTLFEMEVDRVEWISEGLIVVRYEGKDGYVDRHGSWVITPRFHKAHAFNGPLAVVQQPITRSTKELGYVNREGKIVYKTAVGGFDFPAYLVNPEGLGNLK
jgi:hypothetical protein